MGKVTRKCSWGLMYGGGRGGSYNWNIICLQVDGPISGGGGGGSYKRGGNNRDFTVLTLKKSL